MDTACCWEELRSLWGARILPQVVVLSFSFLQPLESPGPWERAALRALLLVQLALEVGRAPGILGVSCLCCMALRPGHCCPLECQLLCRRKCDLKLSQIES